MTTTKTLDEIALDPDNLRKSIDPEEQKGLKQSIASIGLLEPILVRPNGTDGHVIVVAGERRLRAVQELVKEKVLPKDHPIEVTIRDLTQEQIVEAMLVENLQRVDLNPVEEALGYLKLVGFGRTQKQISEAIGRNPKYISARLRIASLPQHVLDAIVSGEVTLSHADVLADLVEAAGADATDDEAVMTNQYIAERALRDAQTANAVQAAVKFVPKPVEVIDLPYEERELLKKLGTARVEGKTLDPPKGATKVYFSPMHDGNVMASFYRDYTPAEAKKAGVGENKPKTSDAEKRRKAADRAERDRIREFATALAKAPKVADVNAMLLPLVATLVNRSEEAKTICPILGIEPKITKVNVGGGKFQNQKDWIAPLMAYFAKSDAQARKVAIVFFATNYRTQGELFKRLKFDPKKAPAAAKAPAAKKAPATKAKS